MKKIKPIKISKGAIEAILLTLIEDTELDQDIIVQKVADMLETAPKKVEKIIRELDF